jgi:amino acid permease
MILIFCFAYIVFRLYLYYKLRKYNDDNWARLGLSRKWRIIFDLLIFVFGLVYIYVYIHSK